MSTIATTANATMSSHTDRHVPQDATRPSVPTSEPVARAPSQGIFALLFAAVVSAFVVLADQWIETWSDRHLLLTWALLWAVIFAGLAWYAESARSLAVRVIDRLKLWMEIQAEVRAQAQLWEYAHNDQRLRDDMPVAQSSAIL